MVVARYFIFSLYGFKGSEGSAGTLVEIILGGWESWVVGKVVGGGGRTFANIYMFPLPPLD